MSRPLVIDASVVVEYLVDLTWTQQITRLFREFSMEHIPELWTPDLVYPEVLSALRKLIARRLVTSEAAQRAVEQLLQLPFCVVSTAKLAASAWRFRMAMTPYDACYAALAHQLEAPLVTCDGKLAMAARKQGVLSWGPERWAVTE